MTYCCHLISRGKPERKVRTILFVISSFNYKRSSQHILKQSNVVPTQFVPTSYQLLCFISLLWGMWQQGMRFYCSLEIYFLDNIIPNPTVRIVHSEHWLGNLGSYSSKFQLCPEAAGSAPGREPRLLLDSEDSDMQQQEKVGSEGRWSSTGSRQVVGGGAVLGPLLLSMQNKGREQQRKSLPPLSETWDSDSRPQTWTWY